MTGLAVTVRIATIPGSTGKVLPVVPGSRALARTANLNPEGESVRTTHVSQLRRELRVGLQVL